MVINQWFCSKKCWNKIVWHFIGVNAEQLHGCLGIQNFFSCVETPFNHFLLMTANILKYFSILEEGFHTSALLQNVSNNCHLNSK